MDTVVFLVMEENIGILQVKLVNAQLDKIGMGICVYIVILEKYSIHYQSNVCVLQDIFGDYRAVFWIAWMDKFGILQSINVNALHHISGTVIAVLNAQEEWYLILILINANVSTVYGMGILVVLYAKMVRFGIQTLLLVNAPNIHILILEDV